MSETQGQPTQHKLILLTMVKNESRIIHRLMSSVKGKVDAIVICDTGSTDNTVSLANEFLGEHGVEGKVYSYPFKNFGASRTQSFHCCQDWVTSVGWDAASTWALLLDGDMLMTDPVDRMGLARLDAKYAGVSLKQANGSLLYSNMRVLRCSEPWICKGATHEAWTCPPARDTILFQSPVLTDHGDGGCKSDKYERDVRLLKEDLAEMPNDARTHFYLGQTYLCMRDWPNAVEVLKKRIEIGGWDEEIYIARIYLGECYENMKNRAEAIHAWMQAFQSRPHRTEAPMRIINLYRKEPNSQMLAAMFLEKMFAIQFGEDLRTGVILNAPARNNDVLFVNKREMEHTIWEEMSILAYYTGLQKQTWLQIDRLDLTTRLGWHDFNGLFGQLHWYDWMLKPRRHMRFQIPLERLPWAGEAEAACWQPFNPSIRAKSDRSGYTVNLRFANYYTNEAKHYLYRAFEGKVLTRNCLLDVPREAGWNDPATAKEILIDPSIPQRDHYIRGVEDCRLLQGTDALEFLGTSQSYSDNGTNKIFHVWSEGETHRLKQMALPPGVSAGETQKNWLGFRHGPQKELLYIYNFSPFKICAENGEVRVNVTWDANAAFTLKEYRGSAGPVPWSSSTAGYTDEAYLCVMHKVYIGGEGRRYYHRFMTLDKDLKPSRVSCFIRMTKERVEYWSGMCPSIEGDTYWITYGCKDSEAYIAEMRVADIEALMMYDMKKGVCNVATAERIKRIQDY